MHYELNKDTFFVSEIFRPNLCEVGRYYYYTLEKKGLSHKKVCNLLPKGISFSGIKDKHATTKQWVSAKERIEDIDEEDLKLKYKGQSNQKIFIGIHKGNAFRVLLNVSKKEAEKIKKFKPKEELVANYFGEQRFSQKNIKVAELIEEKKWESALKVFLCEETKMDSERSKKMREIISENWGKWKEIANDEELKETRKRIVFDFLAENDGKFEEAFMQVEPKSMSIVVKTAQAIRFNKELNKIVKEKKPNNFETQIAGLSVALGANKAMKRFIIIEPTEFEKKFRKASLERRTFFEAQKFKVKKTNEEEKIWIEFELDSGQYATIFLKYLQKWTE